jgi:aminoglycoside phosphotransferase family enzyme
MKKTKLSNQTEIIEALKNPNAYENNPKKIDLIQTHISFIFLTDRFVYKIKKAVEFGFLDFGTLEKRRKFCKKELEINRELCKDMYLEVVPINKLEVIKIKGKGKTVEYAVKMKNIPQKKLMNKLLEKNKITKGIINQISRIIADFHTRIEYKSNTGDFNYQVKLDPIVEINWKENFEQTEAFIDNTIPSEKYFLIKKRIENFIKNNLDLFKNRMKNRKVRFCHGDIHSGNIFIVDNIYIFDAIEFNDRIRYSDVIADIGFLAMDLDFRNKPKLAQYLIDKYIEYSKDTKLKKLLPFYKCYRAYVRGKVVSFKLNDKNINEREKIQSKKEAQNYFELAAKYTLDL